MERYIAIARENRKHNMIIPLLVCLVLFLGSPLVVGIENLTEFETAKVLEHYLVFWGIILLPPVFLAEQNRDIRDLIASKYTSMAEIYMVRIFQAVFALMILSAAYLWIMKLGHCTFSYGKLYGGTLAGMVFLGGLGVLVYGITDQIVIGYMVPLLYFILNITSSYEKLGIFYLFSMCEGKYVAKWCMLGIGAVFLAGGVAIRVKRR